MIFGELIIICYLCIAEEKVDDGFMPMTPKKPDGGFEPHQTLPKKKADSGFVQFFQNVKHFRKQQKMLTSSLVKQIKQ